ncbi:polysaccharide biosynthesis C-terminal domain-containing protein [Phocea massiliensis]|jgi:O-antigen/teichoic acid export membrane protein|uniref:Polysaccharide biosynthesis protein n=1 Tax=uncultured Anaerotruncus sp. TaxID=905011 RepID=A0A6N2UG44_9FIRM|nr:polysaccharide biosynthesis C-terminal domain-containing protein [Merdimmobilis hominis]MCD4835329.1 polysaccharide biosynthesis C-terminal domain-containing protein [Merdimmobilis hominis]PWL64663.1 MAG: polysaccharide biosynthesis protein [Oscillospiraceae bacterium]
MNKYKKLIGNTVIFAIGSFSSKLLVFLLMPLYTRVLTTSDYGVMDIIVNTSNLLIPIVMVSINEGIIRFGLDRSVRKSDVLSTGLGVCLAGFLVFGLFIPLMKRVEFISSYTMLIYAYVLAGCLKSVVSQFVRAIGYVKLYAFDGILSTFTTVVFNILLLVVFKWGINGYVLSTVLSNVLSVLFLFWIANLKKFVKPRQVSPAIAKAMLVYSLPLIPTTIFWWITNVSGRYMVTYFLGESANGLFSVAYKIPTVITMISGIFSQAWQISAVTEADDPGQSRFYSDIFSSYQTVVFMCASGVLLLIKPITAILVSEAFYPSWKYVPFLVLSVIFSCFVTFLGTFYMVAKKNAMALVTTCVGAGLNLVLNYFLIPKYGVNGAAFATFACYFTVFVLRAVDTRRIVRLDLGLGRMALNTLGVAAQALCLLYEVKFLYPIQIGIVLLLCLVNLKSIGRLLFQALRMVGIRL